MYQQKIDQIKSTESAVELTYFVCQMLTLASKADLQSLLDMNDPELRMTTVNAMLMKELTQINEQRDKRDRANKSLKDRMMGMAGP